MFTSPLHWIHTILLTTIRFMKSFIGSYHTINHHLVHVVFKLLESHNGRVLSVTKDILRQFVEHFEYIIEEFTHS